MLTKTYLSLTDSVEDDFELSTVCHRPESMDKLQEQTKFTKKELQVLYRGFKNVGLVKEDSEKTGVLAPCVHILCKMGINEFTFFKIYFLYLFSQECPSGVVNEENFKNIYSQFFPQGGEFSQQ